MSEKTCSNLGDAARSGDTAASDRRGLHNDPPSPGPGLRLRAWANSVRFARLLGATSGKPRRFGARGRVLDWTQGQRGRAPSIMCAGGSEVHDDCSAEILATLKARSWTEAFWPFFHKTTRSVVFIVRGAV